ncbi:ABC transporter permease [Calothrix sp. HK-06]|nr:ABC transporter permease [Calothrix sp. HK-06]
MIHSLKLQNFKPFKEQLLEFRPLTLLSGLNGMGKSSVLQSLLLLRQSYQQRVLQHGHLALNGDLVRIGTAQDALFEGAEEEFISFELSVKLYKEETMWKWRFAYDQKADVLRSESVPNTSEIHEFCLFGDYFHYLQAERIGPINVYEMADEMVRQHFQLGTAGDYTAHFLSLFGNCHINTVGLQKINNQRLNYTFERPSQDMLRQLRHPNAKSPELKDQVEAWMGEISPGTRIYITSNTDIDLISVQYSFAMGNDISNKYRATNVGFGISYTLPIIVALLAPPPGTLVLLENPESHLHPRGQKKMGELIALAASSGIQVVVETHSDHVLNGIRLAVHGGKLKPNDVQLHYFQRQEKKGQTFTNVVSPHIDRNGRIDRWPDGFFDEWDKSLETLLEPAGEQNGLRDGT